jgi:LysM repeat protein
MMSKKKETVEIVAVENEVVTKPSHTDLAWTDYVLGLLSDDEKIKGNPTTDGLRRVFEIALDCTVIHSDSKVIQSPSPDNGMRATVTHSLTFVLNDRSLPPETLIRSSSGAADVYWGNCDKIYRNHPVAVAETRAEGRALRRALRLRKVVAAEELAEELEDHPDGNSVNKITNNQINFIEVLSQRLNIDVKKLLKLNSLEIDNVYTLQHQDAVMIIRVLSRYQQNVADIPESILGYSTEWK